MADRDRIDREHLRSTLESSGFRVLFAQGFKPTLDSWRRSLLTNVDLPEDERRALVRARLLFQKGIEDAYRTLGSNIPEWLVHEFELEEQET